MSAFRAFITRSALGRDGIVERQVELLEGGKALDSESGVHYLAHEWHASQDAAAKQLAEMLRQELRSKDRQVRDFTSRLERTEHAIRALALGECIDLQSL